MPSSLFFVSAMDWISISLKLLSNQPKAQRLALPDWRHRFHHQLSSDPVWRKKPNTHGNAPLYKFRQLHCNTNKPDTSDLSTCTHTTDSRDPITLPPIIDTIQLLRSTTRITNLTDHPYRGGTRLTTSCSSHRCVRLAARRWLRMDDADAMCYGKEKR